MPRGCLYIRRVRRNCASCAVPAHKDDAVAVPGGAEVVNRPVRDSEVGRLALETMDLVLTAIF